MHKIIIIYLSMLLLISIVYGYHMYDQYSIMKSEKDYLGYKYDIIEEEYNSMKINYDYLLSEDNNTDNYVIENVQEQEEEVSNNQYIIQDTGPTAWEIQEQRREQEKIQKQQQEQLEIQQRNQEKQQDNILKCNQYYQKVADYNQCKQEGEMEHQTELLEYNNCVLEGERYCTKPIYMGSYCGTTPYKPSGC